MVIHNGKLLVRHAGLKDQPFVVYDKDSLKPIEETSESKFKHSDDDDEKLKKLDWSEEKIPNED